ncbi:unnamed protein product [Trifolium pratense]|uniref:Uncharacterized protein n=1 Tax=Trifolium pratense TaxID=57577 RepID=A0ACB0JEM2_TRIPR|nr:unnamed protein product [Trifolium pratense]
MSPLYMQQNNINMFSLSFLSISHHPPFTITISHKNTPLTTVPSSPSHCYHLTIPSSFFLSANNHRQRSSRLKQKLRSFCRYSHEEVKFSFLKP